MALRSFLLLATFLFLVTQVSSDIENEEQSIISTQLVKGSNRRLLALLDCDGLCKVRCSLHSRPNVCTRACGTCCFRCKCVPPGTSGNREVCGKCYTEMTTHANKTKCP